MFASKFVRGFFLILLSDAFTGTFVAAADNQSAENQIPVGVLLPLSGAYAAVGKDCQLGIEMAVREKTALAAVDFKYEDVQAEPKLAVAGFGKLVDASKVQALLAVRGPVGMAVNPLSAERKILLLGAVGHSDFASTNPYAVQFWTTGQEEGKRLAGLMTSRGEKRVALFTAEDEWLESVSEAFRVAVSNEHGVLAYDQSFPSSETDFQSVVSKAVSAKPDAIVINVSISQLGILARRLREQGFNGAIWANFWFPKSQVLEAAGSAAEGVRFVEMRTSYAKFSENAKQIGGNQRPSAMVYSCYSAANYLAELIKIGATTREAMTAAIPGVSSVSLADGPLEIRDRRAQFLLIDRTIKAGAVVDLD